MQKTYPDISGILAAKAQRRLALAALSWEEKVAIIERMRELLPRDMWREGFQARSRTASGAPGADEGVGGKRDYA